MATAPTDRPTIVLQRWLADDTVESEAAFRRLKPMLKAEPSRIYIVPDGYTNPLRFVVDEQREELDACYKEIARLTKQLEKVGGGQNKMTEFPWGEYPELECEIARMFFVERRSFEEIEVYVEDETGIVRDNTSKPATQRLRHKAPPAGLNIEVKTGSGPTTWLEIWRIGSFNYGQNWLRRVLNYAGTLDKLERKGRIADGWNRMDVNKVFNGEARNHLRAMFHSNTLPSAAGARSEILNFAKDSGRQGTTIELMKARGLEQRRFGEILRNGDMFEANGRIINTDFADHYVNQRDPEIATEASTAKANRLRNEHRKERKASRAKASAR